MKLLFRFLGCLISYLYPPKINKFVLNCRDYFYTGWRCRKFKKFDKKSRLCCCCYIGGEKMIEVNGKVYIGSGTIMTAQVTENNKTKTLISIEDGSIIGRNNHITAVNGIFIGKNLYTGPSVLISDNAHGDPCDIATRQISPSQRQVYSKGPIKIGNNVWIGEHAAIMANVTIGDGAIIGANSVVTHDVEENSIYVGVPAKKIERKCNMR